LNLTGPVWNWLQYHICAALTVIVIYSYVPTFVFQLKRSRIFKFARALVYSCLPHSTPKSLPVNVRPGFVCKFLAHFQTTVSVYYASRLTKYIDIRVNLCLQIWFLQGAVFFTNNIKVIQYRWRGANHFPLANPPHTLLKSSQNFCCANTYVLIQMYIGVSHFAHTLSN
jgi:hypothetical protein